MPNRAELLRSRRADQLRPISVSRGFTTMTPGSVLIEMGKTIVLATATVSDSVPRWMRNSGRGWVTAEYAMLPGSSNSRIRRSAHLSGRPKEISRLIGRSLRAVTDLEAMSDVLITVDCDVIQADGGTRTASVNAGWIALHDALTWAAEQGMVAGRPLTDRVSAVSVGLVHGVPLLDLDFDDDRGASVDLNVVMAGDGLLVEVQGNAEGKAFSRMELNELLDLAETGIREIGKIQDDVVAS